MSKVLDGQTSLELFGMLIPGRCDHEQKTVDIGGGKSLCELMGCWTNCREVEHCVYMERWKEG